jgi:hypothetical protein
MDHKMNPEIKALWLEQLRSDEFTQTTGYLHNENGFCCLGVLCEIAVNQGVVSTSRDASIQEGEVPVFSYRASTDDYAECSTLPSSVQEWSGASANPHVEYNGVFRPLSDLNDEEKLDFFEIASLIEEQL